MRKLLTLGFPSSLRDRAAEQAAAPSELADAALALHLGLDVERA